MGWACTTPRAQIGDGPAGAGAWHSPIRASMLIQYTEVPYAMICYYPEA